MFIDMFHDLVDEKSNKRLPIFKKLHAFFANKESSLEFKFDELVD